MLYPRSLTMLLQAAMLALALLLLSGALVEARAQPRPPASVADEAERGIALYKQGDDKGAIEALRGVLKIRGEDIAAWHFLGLAYSRQGKTNDAREAHEKAAKSADKLLELFYSSNDNPPINEKSESLLEMAAESAEEFIKLSPNLSGKQLEEWNTRMDILREYSKLTDASGNALKIYKSSEVDTRVKILSRPAPAYPREARRKEVAGMVVLSAVLSFDGKVRNIRVVKGLPYGVTLSAIRAARLIKFTPATLSGQPVSQRVLIEYYFSLY
ncbi:MAG: TonB family protein [Pyrinomonadaceae bacterium]|nr:TonB family protein [Pyrinomonadaceae bacterium]